LKAPPFFDGRGGFRSEWSQPKAKLTWTNPDRLDRVFSNADTIGRDKSLYDKRLHILVAG